MNSRRARSTAAWCAALAWPLVPAIAQTYPAKPIRMIVSFAPGGATDTFARVVAQQAGEAMGQQIIVDNRPGAGTTIAADLVAKAQPDGYTLLFTDIATHTITPAIYPKLPYGALKDFAPVALIASSPMMVVAHPSTNVRTVPQLIAAARQHGPITYGSSGTGTVTHLSLESLKTRTGIELVHVPFKGGATSVVSVMTGEIALAIATIPAVLPHVQSRRLVAVAVTSAKRATQLPDVPAIAETVKGFDTAVNNGVLAPARTPQNIVGRLNAELNRAVDTAKAKEVFAMNAAEAVKVTPAALAEMMARDTRSWAEVVKASGVKVQ
jgi:tripartite-type tricarboxylate transporter receptor subunit TctC